MAPARTRLLVVTSLYPTEDRPSAGAFVERRVGALRARGVEVVVIGPRAYRGSAVVRHLDLLRRAIVARGPFDGVEAHVLFPTGLTGLVAARIRRRPLLVYAHGSDVMSTARRNVVTRTLARLVARGAGRVVTNSRATAEAVRALGAGAAIVSPGVDLRRFAPGDQAAARRALGLRADERIALFVGELAELKGADLFAEAIAGAPAWAGIAIGGGPLAAIVAASPRVRVVGSVAPESLPRWMLAADVLVAPSRREGLGLAAIEALASGTPVVATAVGGLREVVADDRNGLLVPPLDPAALAAALRRLEDDELRSRLASAAPGSVADHDLDRSTARMAELWRELGVEA